MIRITQILLVFSCLLATAGCQPGATKSTTASTDSTAKDSTPKGYHLIRKITVGGEGGFDYVLVAGGERVYASHGTQVEVVDLAKGAKIGELKPTMGVHGIAVVAELNRAYTTDGKADQLSVFDATTFKKVDSVKTGKKPDAIFYDAGSKRIFIFNGNSDNATVYDPFTKKVVGTVALGGGPEAGVADGRGSIFVNLEDKNQIVEFDAMTLKVKHHYSLAPGDGPTGLAIDTAKRLLFSVCANKVMVVMNADNGKVVGTDSIGEHADGAAFDAKLGLAFSSNGGGTLTIVKTNAQGQPETVQTVKTHIRAKTISLDPINHHVYLTTAEFEPQKGTERPKALPGTFMVLEYGPGGDMK